MKKPLPKKIGDLVPEIAERLERSRFDEDYPHVSDKLCLFWGSEFFMDYVEQLIITVPRSDRQTRQGFPFEALKEIRLIVEAHNDKFPQYARIINLWIC